MDVIAHLRDGFDAESAIGISFIGHQIARIVEVIQTRVLDGDIAVCLVHRQCALRHWRRIVGVAIGTTHSVGIGGHSRVFVMQTQASPPSVVCAVVDPMAPATSLAGTTGVREQHTTAIAVGVAILAVVADKSLVLALIKLEGITAV